MTRQDDATATVRAFRTSPWIGVIVLAFGLGILYARGNSRLEALEADRATVAALSGDMRSVKQDVAAILCTLDSVRIEGCYRLRPPINPGARRGQP